MGYCANAEVMARISPRFAPEYETRKRYLMTYFCLCRLIGARRDGTSTQSRGLSAMDVKT